MDLDERDCPELTQKTADTIDDVNLHQLFISTQMNNLDLCVKSAIQSGLHLKYSSEILTLLSQTYLT